MNPLHLRPARGRRVAVLLAATLLAATLPAGAQTLNQREATLQSRINNAARSGQITPKERAVLQDRLNQIRVMERRAKADGVLTKAEYNRINAAMDGLSKTIQVRKAN